MKLTGKCKVDFDKWYNKQPFRQEWDWSDFEDMSNSMRYGVLVDFFESIGIIIYIKPLKSGEWCCHIKNDMFITETRQKARIKAIEKVNEFYNKL